MPFVVLKTLAYEDRLEEKDAYDFVYCVMHYGRGPENVAGQFVDHLVCWPDEPLLPRAIAILRGCFASDERTPGAPKDGLVSYSRFLADPGRRALDARHRQDAAAVVELFPRVVEGADDREQ